MGGGKEDEGWTAVVSDVTGASDADGVFGVLIKVVRRPVTAVIALARDPTYDSHGKFFAAVLAAWFLLGLVILPRFIGWYYDEGRATSGTQSTIAEMTLLQYFELAVMVPLGFFLFSGAAAIRHTPRTYFKFVQLGAATSLVLFSLMLLARVAIVVLIYELLPEASAETIVEHPMLILAVTLVMFAALIGYTIVLNRTFWDVRWRYAIIIVVALLAVDYGVFLAGRQLIATAPVQALLAVLSG